MATTYPIESPEAHPPHLYPGYRSTVRRAPSRPLVILPHTLSELTGPVYGHESVREHDGDLTRQHAGEPLGERIVVSGRVLDEDGRPVPNTLVEIWQANAAGRVASDAEGRYRFTTIKPGSYPWRNHPNAWRPAHIHFSLFGPSFLTRLVTQMYFPGDPLLALDPMWNCIPDEKVRQRMMCAFDIETTEPEWALGYRFDIVLRGRGATPMEDPHHD